MLILFVDDNEDMREVFSNFFSSHGIESICVESGETAYSVFLQRSVYLTCIITDLESGGIWLAKKIRSISAEVPIFLHSNEDRFQIAKLVRRDLFSGFFEKGSRPKDSLRFFSAFLDK